MIYRLSFALCLSLPLACQQAPDQSSRPHAAGGIPGEFKGLERTTAMIRTNLLDPAIAKNQSFALSTFIGGRRANSLVPLLGGFQGEGTENSLKGTRPGTLNFILWQRVMTGFALEMTGGCTTRGGNRADFRLTEAVHERVMAACRAVAAGAGADEAATGLIRVVAGYQLPPEEISALVTFFRQHPGSPAEAVGDLLAAVLLSPFYLLEQ